MAESGESKIDLPIIFKILILFAVLPTFVECQITSVISPKVACVGDDVDIDWVYGDAASFVTLTWTYINSQTSAQTIIMQQTTGGSATVSGNYNVVHKTNGGIKLTGVTLANSGSYKISVTYLSATPPDDDTVTVTVNDCSTTTTTTSTTTTIVPPTSTTTTVPPASTTTTVPPASTTPTVPPALTTTTPASTTKAMSASATTTTSTTTTTTTPTTKKISLTTTTIPVTTPSTTSLSDEIIIVIVVVPVGVIAIVGTVIFVCLFYRLRRGERKPTSQGKHYKGNMRPVQQHQQQPYILYGRGHTRESNHKETKRSRSLHDDRYNWYDGYHWGNQVKQNPVYKDDRNLCRLYYNETLPRNDDYRSGYTTGPVYPTHISGYQYRPDYHGDSRRHGNRKYSSYPVYSRQKEYINPSYSYMGY